MDQHETPYVLNCIVLREEEEIVYMVHSSYLVVAVRGN